MILDVAVSILPDKLKLMTILHSSDLFDPSTIKRMAGQFQTLVEGVVSNPESRLSVLPLLTGSERQQMVEWNDTRRDYGKDKTIQELFN